MRYYDSQFSLKNYKYNDDSNGKYYHLKRLTDGRKTYSVLNLNTIDKIRNILNNKPITEEEQEA